MTTPKNQPQEQIIEDLKKENERLRAQLDSLKNTDTHISDNEKFLKKVVDSLPDMLSILSIDEKFVDLISSEETNHIGESSEKLKGQNLKDMLPPLAYKNVSRNLQQVLKTQRGGISTHTLSVNNEPRHYENRILPLTADHAICICRDVTESIDAKNDFEVTYRKMQAAERMAALSYWYYYSDDKELEAPGILPRLSTDSKDKLCPIDTFLSFVYSADREAMREYLNNPDDHLNEQSTFRIYTKHKISYFYMRITRIFEQDDKRVIEGYVQDMTDIEERLHELEKLKYAVNYAQEEIYSCRTDGSMEFANDKLICHYDLDDTLSNYKIYNLLSFIASEEKWNELLSELKDSGGSTHRTVTDFSDEGKKRHLDISVYIVKDGMDQEHVWFFCRNVSQRVASQSKLRELNRMLDVILNNIPVYLFVKDPGNEFRYLYWNKAFEQHSQIPASNVIGRTDYEIFPNINDAHKFRRDDLELLDKQEKIEFTEKYMSATGDTRIVQTCKSLVPMDDNRMPLIVGVSWDITDMKNTEQELIAARIKAEQSDKLKSTFLANMSHEIRTPLNAIVGFSKLIAMEEDMSEKKQYSDIIDTNADLLLQLINDILDLSKIEAGTLEFVETPMDLSELCRTMHEVHRGRTKPGVELVYNEQFKELAMLGDRNRLSQVITNLITNAIKFTSRGSIEFGFDVADDTINFFVSDTGAGIPKDKANAIFNRFIKLNNFEQGAGLGLSITKTIIERIKGSISVDTEEGVGSTFRFSIPWIKEQSDKSEPIQSQKIVESDLQKTKPEKQTILVAEDIDSNFQLLKILIGNSFNILRARSGLEAISIFKEHNPDLILMDIKMPEVNGLEATRIIRNISSDVPIVAATAFTFDHDMNEAIDVGCNDFIAKPISMTALKQIFDKYLN